MQARIRRDPAIAKKLETQNAKTLAGLLDADDVDRKWGKACDIVRKRIRAIVTRELCERLAKMSSPNDICEAIDAEVYAAARGVKLRNRRGGLASLCCIRADPTDRPSVDRAMSASGQTGH